MMVENPVRWLSAADVSRRGQAASACSHSAR